MNFFRLLWVWCFGSTISELVLRGAMADLWAEFNRRHRCSPLIICLPPVWFWAAVKYARQFDDRWTNTSPLRHGFIWFHGMRVQSNFCDQARCERGNLMLWADLDPKTGAVVAEYAGRRVTEVAI